MESPTNVPSPSILGLGEGDGLSLGGAGRQDGHSRPSSGSNVVVGDHLLDCWGKLNDHFIFGGKDDDFMVAGATLGRSRSFSCVGYGWEIRGKGFGVGPTHWLLDRARRTKLLRSRYVNPQLWSEALNRLKERGTSLGKGAPLSFTFPFYRAADNAPAGGGCLISMTLTWWMGRWQVHVMSRASEITMRLLGDICFVDTLLAEVLREVPLRHWDGRPEIRWTLLLASQMSHIVPYYLLKTRGPEYVHGMMSRQLEACASLREREIVRLFWNETMHPEKVKWAQRRRWGERFHEDLGKMVAVPPFAQEEEAWRSHLLTT